MKTTKKNRKNATFIKIIFCLSFFFVKELYATGNNQAFELIGNVASAVDRGMSNLLHHDNEKVRNGAADTAVRLTNAAADLAIRAASAPFDTEELKQKAEAITKGAISFISNPKVVLGIAAICGSYFLLKHLSAVLGKYLESMIDKPRLVQETSVKTFWEGVTGFFFEQEKKLLTAKDIILSKELKKDYINLIKMTQYAQENGYDHSHVMFYGPPGTGKTLGAKIIAQVSGMDYAIVAGSSFSQFSEGKDIQELDKIIRWANNSPNGLILFIDEADSALGIRNGKSLRADNLVDFFLSNFEKTTHPKIKLIFATNHPEKVDPAILNRVSKSIYIGLPALEERKAQILLNIKNVFGKTENGNLSVDSSVKNRIHDIAVMTEGFTGRSLFDLALHMEEATILSKKQTLTFEIAKKATAKLVQSVIEREKMQAFNGNQAYFGVK